MSKNAIETAEDIAEGLHYLAQICTTMATIIAQVPEVPLRRRPADFASLASIIISQQVSKQSAEAIFGRMERIITPLSAENYLLAGEPAWIEIGLSRPKQQTFIALCNAILDEQLHLETLAGLSAQEAIDTLVSVKGIGPWTAEVYLLSAIGHPDVFPAGDLALQIAAADAYQSGEKMSDKELRLLAESWAPWRSVAARILWAYYAVLKNRMVAP